MNSATFLEVPVLEASSDAESPWQHEKAAFWGMFDQLLKEHKNKYVVIYHGAVVASGDDEIEVALSAYKQYGKVPMYIHVVSSDPIPAARVFSPRVARSVK